MVVRYSRMDGDELRSGDLGLEGVGKDGEGT